MASGATIKVRFVRCPKCRLVLPEVADVPMYKCGGCETILIAKNRQTNGRNSIPLKETETSDTKNEVLESETKESISSNQKEVLASDDGEVHPDKESGNPQHASKECIEEKPDLDFSNEGKQNGGYQSDQDSACLNPTGVDGDCTANQNGSVGFASKQLIVKLSEDEDEAEDDDEDKAGSNQDKIAHTDVHSSGVSNDNYSHNDLVHNDNDGQSPAPVLAGKSTVDVSGLDSGIGVKNIESTDDSNARSLSTSKQIASGESGLTVPVNGPETESISSEKLASSDDAKLEQTLEINHHGVSRVTSIDTFYSVDAVGPSSERSGALEYESKSTTGGSAHSYESSVSSCDRTDDLICDKRMDPSENSYEVPSHHVPEERPRRNKFLSHSIKSCTYGVQHQLKNFPSDLSEGKYYSAKHKGHRDKVIEHTMYDHPVRSRERFGGSGYPYEAPIPQRAKFAAYESGSTSTPLHDEFSRVSNFHSLDGPEDSEKEKKKLLRMVYELQNQLQRSSFFNGKAPSEDSWCEDQFPSYFDYEAHEKEVLYPSYPERHMLSNWGRQHEYSHIPFSGNTMDSRIRDYHSYHPKDWCSAPLPPQALHHNRAFFRKQPDVFYTSNSSWPSSPQRFSRSPFPVQSYEVMSDDQRYKDRIANRYPREKPGIAKRHLRPTAGGAPLATCSSCMSLLQMPADFIVSRKGLHRLKCGACSTILKFSLESKKHLVPYDPILQVPPQSNLDDNSDTMKQQTSHVYPVSCSDDYGVSYKSYSTEGEPSSAAPPIEPPGNYVHRKSRSKHESPVEASVSAGASTSEALDMEELPQRGGSPLGPLHRLMGYSSVSQVFKGPERVDSSKYSNHAEESSQKADKLRMLKKEKRLKQEIE